MKIQAIATEPKFDIQATLQHPEVKGVFRILAKSGVKVPTTSKIPHSELESCMAAAGITPEERMRTKIALDRAKLIAWDA
jgi:hypothetical protein